MRKINKEEIVAALKEMSLLEIKELIESIESEFGVTAASPAASAATVSVDPPSGVSLILAIQVTK